MSNPNEQTFQVVASQSFQGSSSPGVRDLSGLSIPVSAGDLLAFAGIGPYYTGNNDALNSDATYEDSFNPGSYSATPPGGVGTQFTVGLNFDGNVTYDYISDLYQSQGRTYAIGVQVPETSGGTPPGPLDHFAISAIASPQTAGTAFAIAITAQDVNNNTVTSFTGPVTFGGTAGVTGTSGPFISGVLNNASVVPTVAGSSQSVMVTDGASPTAHTGMATIAVNAGAATQLVFTSAPVTVTAAIGGTKSWCIQNPTAWAGIR